MFRLLKKGTIKLTDYLKSPRRVEKLVKTADFHKRCEYFQSEIQILFDNEVFELKNGAAILHKDNDAKIRKIEFNFTSWRG